MKKFLLISLLLLIPSLCEAQGSGTPYTLRVKVDANGYLLAAATAQTNPITTSVFTNARLKTDSSGNLLVVLVGGATITGGACTADQFVNAISTAGVPTCLNVFTVPSLVTTSTDGLIISNNTAATSGVPVQVSPRLRFNANVWNTTSVANNTSDAWFENVPQSSTTPNGIIRLQTSLNGAGAITAVSMGAYPTTNTFSALWFGVVPSSSNYAFLAPNAGGQTILNTGTGQVEFRVSNTSRTSVSGSGLAINFADNTAPTIPFSVLNAAKNATLFAIQDTGLITTVSALTTVGRGVPAIVANGRVTAQSAANSSIATFTVGAADGSFEVSGNFNATAVTTLVTTLTCTYTDESNTARTMIFPVSQLSGSFIAGGAITGTGAWETPLMHIRAKATTVITILTSTGTFTGVTYTAEGIIKQMS